MSKIKLIANGINVVPLVAALQRNPQFWNEHTMRTENETSPHYELDDIWVRFNDIKNYNDNHADFISEHDSVWYPCTDVLPVKDLVYPLMAAVKGERLGGILITRIKPGQICKPHEDTGWHAKYYHKYAIQLQGNIKQAFHFEDESLVTFPGDVYWFDNSFKHWVTNDSDQDRITMIVCIKHD